MTLSTSFIHSIALLEQIEQALQTPDYGQLAELIARYSNLRPVLTNAEEQHRLLVKHEAVMQQLNAVRQQVGELINQTNTKKLGHSYQAV